MFNEEHRRLIRAGLGILARALEPAHPPSHESSARLADAEPSRFDPPASPVAAVPAQPIQAVPVQPVQVAPVQPIQAVSAQAEPVTPEPPASPAEPQYTAAASRFFRGLPWSVSPVAEARLAHPEASEPAPSFPQPPRPTSESPADSPQAAAGGYFQAVFRRQAVDATPAPPAQPDRTERPKSAAGYFSGLPWRPVAPPPMPEPEAAPPLGLSAAIMRAATRSALQSAERLAETQRPSDSPVAAASYFQSLPWRSRTAADGTHP